MKKLPDDVPRTVGNGSLTNDYASSVAFLVVSFNGVTPIEQTEIDYCKAVPFDTSFMELGLLRLLYAEYCTAEIPWQTFIKAALKPGADAPSVLALSTVTFDYVHDQLKTRYGGDYSNFVIIVEEVAKTRKFSRHTPAAIRSALCREQDTSGVMCLFTSLDKALMDEEHTVSGRAVTGVPLPPFTPDEVMRMLKGVVNEKSIHPLVVNVLAGTPGGHGRSIEHIIRAIKHGKKRFSEVVAEAAENLKNMYPIHDTLIIAALKADEVEAYDTVKVGGVNRTYDSCVADGSLIDSLASETSFVPRVPELFLHAWLRKSYRGTNQMIITARRCLAEMFARRDSFRNEDLEDAHGLFEELRVAVGKSCMSVDTTLFDVYANGPLSGMKGDPRQMTKAQRIAAAVAEVKQRCPAFFYHVDASHPKSAPTRYAQVVTDVERISPSRGDALLDKIYLAPVQNTGFDILVFYKATDPATKSSFIMPVAIQCKWKWTGSNTHPRLADSESSYNNTRDVLQAAGWKDEDKFALIMLKKNTAVESVTTGPKNTMHLTVEHFDDLYSTLR